jgi:hypothetical protein
MTYLAASHAHVPVDMISEPDLADGLLKGYKLLYVGETNIARAAAARIVAWVKAGGVLQLGPGAGTRDEYNEPMADLTDLAGVKVESVDRPGGGARERYELQGMAAKGEVTLAAGQHWSAAKVPVFGYTESATAQGAQVLASFADGKPALFLSRPGKGAVLHLAFMPGLAYFRGAKGGAQDLKTGFDPAKRALLTAGMKLAAVVAPLTVSEPLVEAQILRGPMADVVMLANWSGADLPLVTVTIRGASQRRTVASTSRAPLTVKREGPGLTVTLRLRDTDALVLPK